MIWFLFLTIVGGVGTLACIGDKLLEKYIERRF